MSKSSLGKRALACACAAAVCVGTLAGCSESSRVDANITKDADNFNQVRTVTVINCFDSSILFQMTGKMSINADMGDEQLEVIVEDEDGGYKKHFIGLSDNVTYVVEDVTSDDIDQYTYHLNFNPKMLEFFDVTTID